MNQTFFITNLPALATAPNQEATAVALEQVTNSTNPDARIIRDALSPLRTNQVPLVLDMMAGETLTAFTNLRLNNARLFGNMISRRLSASNWELERPPARAPLDVKRPQDNNPALARGGPGLWIEPFGIFGNNQGEGQATDIEIHAKEILDLRRRLNGIYEKHSGKTIKQIEKIMDRDTFMTAEDAKAFGLIDQVVEKRPLTKTEV